MTNAHQPTLRFNRMELAGSLGDLGTLLPIAMGMILINGLNPTGVLVSIGAFYILSGLYFGLTVPVQPMKVIGAYALATALSPDQITAAGLIMGAALLIGPTAVYAQPDGPLTISVFPRRNAALTMRMFSPLARHLENELGRRVHLRTSANFDIEFNSDVGESRI